MSNDMKKCPVTHLTTDAGAPVVDNQNSMTAGARGPLLSQDLWLHEKLGNFVREVIPERRMHAKGSGAFGTFTVTHDITPYTRAKVFSEVGKKTDIFVRFSTVAGERGAADAERDIRGFAIKFYTEEGNWDQGLLSLFLSFHSIKTQPKLFEHVNGFLLHPKPQSFCDQAYFQKFLHHDAQVSNA